MLPIVNRVTHRYSILKDARGIFRVTVRSASETRLLPILFGRIDLLDYFSSGIDFVGTTFEKILAELDGNGRVEFEAVEERDT
jgi:hypothetical protein